MPKRKRIKGQLKQQSIKHTHKTKDWVIRTPLKTRGEHFFLLDHSSAAAKKKKTRASVEI